MSVQKVNVLVPPFRAEPRGALALGGAASWLFGADDGPSSSLSGWVHALCVKRAADRAERREAQARSELMALARRYASSQPEFAKDLIAAARNDRG